MHGRIADSLLYLSKEIYRSDTFDTCLSRQELANMSSMTKESAIRILKKFTEDGIIENNIQHFKIVDLPALEKISITG
jgi:CRP/FNR family transcriptional regulator